MIAHVLGGVFNGFVYKNASWRFKDNKVVSLALWAAQVLVYYFLVIVPLIVAGIMVFFPDPANGTFFNLLALVEVGAIPEAVLTTVVSTIVMAALPERYRRPLW
jgi:polyferredoxin